MRKTKGASHVNHERWLVSYADFITLMFAFFVVMFASSQADRSKAKQLSNAIENAFAQDSVSARLRKVLYKTEQGTDTRSLATPVRAKMAELKSPLKELTRALKDEISKGNLQVSMTPRGLV